MTAGIGDHRQSGAGSGLLLGKTPETGMAITDMRNQQQGRRRGRGGPRPPQQGGIVRPDLGRQTGNRGTGNAAQMLEKYKTLARDATQAGDRITAEYYFQYADHYFRVLNENRPRFEERQQRPQQVWQEQGGDADSDSREEDEGYGSADTAEAGYATQRTDRYRPQDRDREDARPGEYRYGDRGPTRDFQASGDNRADRGARSDREPRAEQGARDGRSSQDERGERFPRRDARPLDRAVRSDRDDQARDERSSQRERRPAAERAETAVTDPFARAVEAAAREPDVRSEPSVASVATEMPRPRRGRPRREDVSSSTGTDDPFAVRRSPARADEAAPQAGPAATAAVDEGAAPKRRRRSPRTESEGSTKSDVELSDLA